MTLILHVKLAKMHYFSIILGGFYLNLKETTAINNQLTVLYAYTQLNSLSLHN